MFNLFKNKINSAWGLHFTDKFLRAAELEKKEKPWKIKRVGRKELAPGIVKNGLVTQPKQFQEYLTRMKNEAYPSSFKSPYVIVNAPEEHVFIRTIKLPPIKDNEEIGEAVRWEAESNIPMPVEKVYLSWELLPEKTDDKKIHIILTATPRNIIDALTQSIRKVGLMPLVIEPESTAVVRNILENNPEDLSQSHLLIVNMGEESTRFIVFDRFTVRVSTITKEAASVHFDKAIEENLKIKPKEVYKLRTEVGWDETNKLSLKLMEATGEPFRTFKNEIEDTLEFYADHNPYGDKINQILLAGKRKHKWPGFDKYLEKQINKPVNWEQLWSQDQWFKKSPFEKKESEEYNAAVGLALRSFEESF